VRRVVVRGGGEMATAAARLLFLSGFRVSVLERERPLAVRRLVSFAEAVFAGEVEVEGVRARLVGEAADAGEGYVPVRIDEEATSPAAQAADAFVDGRMTKRGSPRPGPASALVIGLGPGFTAGRDVDAVVETQRGPDLGRVLWSGGAEPDTAVPAPVLGHTETRVLRAPRGGTFGGGLALGTMVRAGDVVGTVAGEAVTASIAGLLRGLVHDGVTVEEAMKVGDVDPRGASVDPARISDKARAVAAGVLEAALLRARGLR
jgi:xanthine dehydrogenase accessory factor